MESDLSSGLITTWGSVSIVSASRAGSTLVWGDDCQAMSNWNFDDVLATINETIELARLRAICPAQLTGSAPAEVPMGVGEVASGVCRSLGGSFPPR